jgi:hypothetical protein
MKNFDKSGGLVQERSLISANQINRSTLLGPGNKRGAGGRIYSTLFKTDSQGERVLYKGAEAAPSQQSTSAFGKRTNFTSKADLVLQHAQSN